MFTRCIIVVDLKQSQICKTLYHYRQISTAFLPSMFDTHNPRWKSALRILEEMQSHSGVWGWKSPSGVQMRSSWRRFEGRSTLSKIIPSVISKFTEMAFNLNDQFTEH